MNAADLTVGEQYELVVIGDTGVTRAVVTVDAITHDLVWCLYQGQPCQPVLASKIMSAALV